MGPKGKGSRGKGPDVFVDRITIPPMLAAQWTSKEGSRYFTAMLQQTRQLTDGKTYLAYYDDPKVIIATKEGNATVPLS